MAGFFMVLDVPERRLVRYQRIQDRTNGVASEAGRYWAVVTDAEGAQAVSRAAVVA